VIAAILSSSVIDFVAVHRRKILPVILEVGSTWIIVKCMSLVFY